MSLSLSDAERVTGSLSAAASLPVIITYLFFKKARALRYVELVFYVSLHLFVASIGISVGATHSVGMCWFQMITTNLNYLSAIFWSNVMTLQVYMIVYHKKTLTDQHMRYLHVACWGIPALATFIPLFFAKYGNNDDQEAWCFFVEKQDTSNIGLVVVEILGFYFWIWIAILINFVLSIQIALQLKRMAVIPDDIRKTLRKLLFYPIVLIISWIGATIVDIGDIFNVYFTYDGNYFTTVICVLQGVFISIAFFALNKNIRRMWYNFIHGIPDKDRDPSESSRKSSMQSFFEIVERFYTSEVGSVDERASAATTSDYIRSSNSIVSNITSTRMLSRESTVNDDVVGGHTVVNPLGNDDF